MTRRLRKSDCPVHFALNTFGDAWTLLIVRDLMFKERSTYSDFLRAEEGIATNILADRLVSLEQDGVVVKRDGRYRLTLRGIDLLPVLVEMIGWSARYDPDTAADDEFVQRIHGDREGLIRDTRAKLLLDGHGLEFGEPAGAAGLKKQRRGAVYDDPE